MKVLREKKIEAEARLYQYMSQINLEELNGVKIKSIAPKVKITSEDKAQSAIDYLESQGISNASQFYELFKKTQTKSYILGSDGTTDNNNNASEGDSDDDTVPRIVYLNK
jgi:hypothetical protein